MPQSKHSVRAPSHMTLVESYLRLQFEGVAAIVFLDPLGDGTRPERIAQVIGKVIASDVIVNADIYIQPSEDLTLNRFEEDEFGYVIAWDGYSVISENT